MSSAVPDVSRGRRPSSISIVGVVLVVLYIFSVFSVVVSFSAYVLRTDWSADISIDEAEVKDLDYLIYLVRQDGSLTSQIDALQAEIVVANENVDAVSTRIEVLRSNLSDAEADVLGRVDPLSAANDTPTEDVTVLNGPLTGDAAQLEVPTKFAELTPSPEADMATPLPARAVLMSPEIKRINADIKDALADKSRWEDNRLHYLGLQMDQSAARDRLREQLSSASVHRGRWNALHEAGWYNPMTALVPLPTILLTLIATIAAGALGSLVGYSRSSFQAEERLSCSNLLINVGEGIAASIGVFLFAGAGMLVLSQGGGPNGRLELSPFTVAFLAFLSGFMAEAAFTKIMSFGRELFRDDEPKPAPTQTPPPEVSQPS